MIENNRRSEDRISTKATVFVEICSSGPNDNEPANIMICNSLDISSSGIQVEMDKDVAVGSILRLCTQMPDSELQLHLVGEVKWTKPVADGFKIGFELYDAENTDIDSWQELISNKATQSHN